MNMNEKIDFIMNVVEDDKYTCIEEDGYTSDDVIEMERQRRCGLLDREGWDIYLEAEKRNLSIKEAIYRYYAGIPQEWEEETKNK